MSQGILRVHLSRDTHGGSPYCYNPKAQAPPQSLEERTPDMQSHYVMWLLAEGRIAQIRSD